MYKFSNIISVEFSAKQQAFHKSTLADVLNNNINNLLNKKETDYLLVGLFESNMDADLWIKYVYDKFKKSYTDLQQDAAINYFNK